MNHQNLHREPRKPLPGIGGGGTGDRWETLIRRITDAAAPELARLRAHHTLTGQVQAWTRSLLPLAALLIVAFGTLFAWAGTDSGQEAGEAPLLAEVLMPDPLVLWLEAGTNLTLDEIVDALEGSER